MDSDSATDFHFLSLIAAHQQAGLQQLGKIANPMTGKSERNLEGARYAIEVLESLAKKTQGNLTDEEDRVLQEALTMLRLNYVDESRKGDPEGEAEADPALKAETEPPAEAGQPGESGN